jgi:orc1/cdc6 family replication initiation protein
MNNDIVANSNPLQTTHLPDQFIARATQEEQLRQALPTEMETPPCNLYLHGPRGTGKTHLLKRVLSELPQRVQTCHISCIEADTQYKVLQQFYRSLTGENIESGHHTSDLQRLIEKRLGAVPTILVLDEIDLLLHGDDDNLLYYLSRLDPEKQLSIVVVSGTNTDLTDLLESRTYSSLQPLEIRFESYSNKQIYDIIAQRASQSLKPRSLHNNAASYIASSTRNAKIALTWLRTAVKQAEDAVTESHVQKVTDDAHRTYVNDRLQQLTPHHQHLFSAIEELSQEAGPVIQTGSIYDRYQTITSQQGIDALSNRRISDYLKQLEKLNVVEAEYHYGGEKGKTREVRPLGLEEFG